MLLAWQRPCDKRLNEGRTDASRLATQQLPKFTQMLSYRCEPASWDISIIPSSCFVSLRQWGRRYY